MLDQQTVGGATSLNVKSKKHEDCLRGLSAKPVGLPGRSFLMVRPHKVSYKVSYVFYLA